MNHSLSAATSRRFPILLFLILLCSTLPAFADVDLEIRVTTEQTVIAPGEIMTYFIEVEHFPGEYGANMVEIDLTPPAGTTVVDTNGCNEPTPASPICSLGSMPGNSMKNVTVNVAVDPGFIGSTLDYTFTVSSLEPDGVPGNNVDTVNTPVLAKVDLELKIDDSFDPVEVGRRFVYRVDLYNNGPSNAEDVEIEWELDSAVSFVNVGGCSGFPICKIGLMTPESHVIIAALVEVTGGSPGEELLSSAEASSLTLEIFPGDEDDEEPTLIGESVSTVGPDFQISQSNSDDDSEIGIGPNGDFLIAWESSAGTEGTDGFDIFAQQYGSDGNPVGSSFQVNDWTTGDQINPAVAVDQNGDFVIAWEQGESTIEGAIPVGITARYFTETEVGTAQKTVGGPEIQVNQWTTGVTSRNPAVATDDQGFVVVWQNDDNQVLNPSLAKGAIPVGIRGREFPQGGAEGVAGDEFQVNSWTTSVLAQIPKVGFDGNRNFLVVWYNEEEQMQIGSAAAKGAIPVGIRAQLFSAALEGAIPVGLGEFQVSSDTTSSTADSPDVAVDSRGNAVVVWRNQSVQEGAIPVGIVGREMSPSQQEGSGGYDLEDAFQVNLTTAGDETDPQVDLDVEGNFVVTWQASDAVNLHPGGLHQGAIPVGLSARAFSFGDPAQGDPQAGSNEFRIGQNLPGDRRTPHMKVGANRDFVVVWTLDSGTQTSVFGQRYQIDGGQDRDIIFRDSFENGLLQWSNVVSFP